MNKLYNCSQKTFERFIKGKELKQIPGEWFHSIYYVDENNNKVAYMETSSYGVEPIYKIAEENNDDTLNLVNNIMNGK